MPCWRLRFPDRADDCVIGKEDQRVIGGLALIRPTGIVLAVVFRSLAIVLVENAPLTNIVIAGPFVGAPRGAELETSRTHVAALLLFRKRSRPAPLLS